MKLTPVGDRLLIKPDSAEDKTAFGLVLPDAAQERVYRGSVVASAVKNYKEGCRVLYSKYGGTEVKLDGKEYIVIAERDILGVLEDV
jgi:chaperonin GroES